MFLDPYNAILQLFSDTLQSQISEKVGLSFKCKGVYITSEGTKYLFKYVCEGRDRVTIELIRESVNQHYDEIRHFKDARYVPAPEVLSCLHGFDTADLSPPFVRLDVDL